MKDFNPENEFEANRIWLASNLEKNEADIVTSNIYSLERSLSMNTLTTLMLPPMIFFCAGAANYEAWRNNSVTVGSLLWVLGSLVGVVAVFGNSLKGQHLKAKLGFYEEQAGYIPPEWLDKKDSIE